MVVVEVVVEIVTPPVLAGDQVAATEVQVVQVVQELLIPVVVVAEVPRVVVFLAEMAVLESLSFDIRMFSDNAVPAEQ